MKEEVIRTKPALCVMYTLQVLGRMACCSGSLPGRHTGTLAKQGPSAAGLQELSTRIHDRRMMLTQE